MTGKEKIRKAIAKYRDTGYANACQIWKGYGSHGERPYGWWVQPFGRFAYFAGSNVAEAIRLTDYTHKRY